MSILVYSCVQYRQCVACTCGGFSPHFPFLGIVVHFIFMGSVLVLVAVISTSLSFQMQSLNCRSDACTQSSMLVWGCKICRLNLCRGVWTPQRVSWYDTQQSNGEFLVMLELWIIKSIPSVPSLPGPLWSEMVAPDRILSMGQIELNCVLMLNRIAWNGTILKCKWCT